LQPLSTESLLLETGVKEVETAKRGTEKKDRKNIKIVLEV